jgi:hypothetical protein
MQKSGVEPPHSINGRTDRLSATLRVNGMEIAKRGLGTAERRQDCLRYQQRPLRSQERARHAVSLGSE